MSQSRPRTRVSRTIKRSLADLRQTALDAGVIPGDTDYTRFIVLASARTGSNLLARSLGRHSGVVVYGEIMRRADRFPDHFPELGNSQTQFQQAPADFLNQRVFGRQPSNIDAVGFKLFYSHAPQDAPWGQAVWDYLAADKALRIVHLQRQNLLEVEVSRRKAAESDEWIKYSNGKQQPAVTLDYDDMVARFEQMERWQTETAERFSGHPLLNVTYEDMVADFVAQMAAVQDFLGLDYETVEPPTQKRTKRPLREQVANYDEIAARLQDSPWADFLAEKDSQ